MASALRCVLSRSVKGSFRSIQDRCFPRSAAWKDQAGSRPSGELRKITAAQSTTSSPTSGGKHSRLRPNNGEGRSRRSPEFSKPSGGNILAFLRSFLTGLGALFHKERRSQEIDQELCSYLAAAVEEKMRSGISYPEALRAAKVEMGSMEAVKQQIRSAGWESTVDSLCSDFRFSLRMLANSPCFTAVAILSLALGVGANTAIFTLINDLMIKQLPVGQPDQLVSLGEDSGCCVIGTVSMGTDGLFSYE